MAKVAISSQRGGSKPGERRGGRKKGTPNKKTSDIQSRLDGLKCDPIVGMAKIALDEKNTPELRGRMFAELAQYIAPKRKAVEHSGHIEHSHENWLAKLPKSWA